MSAPDATAAQAITELMQQQGGKLYHLARRFCGNDHEAEDLVQETFLAAFRAWDTFRGESDPATWLYTIAARACQRMHRKKSGEPRRVLSMDQPIRADGPVPDLPGRADAPLDRQIAREARAQLEQAIAGLPAHFRMALVLKDIVGLSVEQVARVLGIKPATVKTRVHRARLAVRDAMSGVLPTRDAPPPVYAKRVCLDLLAAKQAALDRRAEFPMPPDFCERCRAVFASMDLAADLCATMGDAPLPATVRRRVERDIASRSPSGRG